MTPSLVRRTIESIWIVGIDHDFGGTSVLADVENILPGLSAIGSLKESSFAAWSPEWSLRSYINDVGVFRINRDATNMFGTL